MSEKRSKVCHLTSVHPWNDDRIFHKECCSLATAGFEVHLVASDASGERINQVHVHGIPKCTGGRLSRMTRTVNAVYRAARLIDADLYHFHDPELLPIGLLLKLHGKKVIYDVHEDVPQQILNKEWLGNRYIRKLVSAVAHIFEQTGALFFDAIVVVTPDIERKFNKDKTIIVANMPLLNLIDKEIKIDSNKSHPIIVYVGALSRIRGIKELISAMTYINKRRRPEFWILGAWESEEFKNECENSEGWQYCRYFGSVPFGKQYAILKAADIGICILLPVHNYLTSLPVKAFEYMTCSLPMVMSNFPYWKKVFGKCAVFANPLEPKDIASKILHLLDSPDEAKELGQKGRELIETKYSWEAESKKLIDLYKKLLT